jgi:surface protein
MFSTFAGADAFNQDISSWDVSNVTNMRFMFSGAYAFNQDISSWDTSKVTSMQNMFDSATAFNQNLGSLPINSVTNMVDMLRLCGMSTENYSRTLIGWANQHFAGNAQNNVTLGATTKTYNNTAYTTGNEFNDAVSARSYLVNTAGWTITDGGQV